MIVALYVILGVYLLLIGSFIFGFYRLNTFYPQRTSLNVCFSVIIPFRNEEQHLPKLLSSIVQLDYPKQKFECIFVDDDSNDDSVPLIQRYLTNTGIDFKIINSQRVSPSPKKDAITTAIHQAQFDWIITTDADCLLPQQWLNTFAAFSEKQPTKMIVGPVTYTSSATPSFLTYFQILDFMSLQGSTVGGFGIGHPFQCNGANLAYKKHHFIQLNGFKGNDTIASGDDIFLFEKFIHAFPRQVHFLRSRAAMVSTFPLESWKAVIEQRTRWAAKSGAYNMTFAKLVGLIVLFMNLGVLMSPAVFFLVDKQLYILGIIPLKLIADVTLIGVTINDYSKKKVRFLPFLLASMWYPFFSIYIVFRALFYRYSWKERKFRA